jgi:hypothetical protein
MSGHARARASTLEGAKSPDSSENLAARAREWTRVLICLSLVMKGSAVRIGFLRFAGVLSLRGRGRAFPDRASTKHYAGRSAGRVAEADLVPVGVAIDGLAYSVGVSLALGGADVTGGDLRHERIEVVHEDRMQRMSGALGVFQDEDRATLGQVPNGLSLVREEGRLGAEQALLPWSRRRVVADADPGVEVECHGPIVALCGACCRGINHLAGERA